MNLTQPTKPGSILFATMVITATVCLGIKPAEGFVAAQEPNQISAAPTAATPESIDAQLKQLDSPTFKDREAATEELIERGAEILKPLSIHFFNSSSEAGWRIHRILEGIGKNAEEKDFLKSLAIIQLLYGSQDLQSQGRLAKLQYQWKATRRNEAARKLGKLGFDFVANESGGAFRDAAAKRALIEIMVRDAGGEFEATTAPNPFGTPKANTPAPTAKWVNPRLDRQNTILQIEKIINGAADRNREIVKGLSSPDFQITLPPGELKVPKGWEFDEESLKLLQDLSTLSSLTLEGQRIDAKLRALISQQKLLTILELINCEFEKDSDKLTFPASIVSLRFEGSLPPPKSFGSLGKVGELTLKLSKVKLDEDVAYALSKRRIQMLDLEEVKFTRKGIQSLVNMRGLYRVSMSLCKFELDWLADIRKRNPNLILAAPKAFLGVQAPPTDRSTGFQLKKCLISQVVEETAAARAGMQDLDVVTAMDGTKISTFEDLRLMISQKRPGDSMQLEIQRKGKTLKLKVDLGKVNESIR